MRYKQLYTLLINLKESHRSIHDISPQEQALLTNIANSHTKSSYKAQGCLYLARGIEFPMPLPALSNGIGNWHTVFKADTNGKVGELYPNPSQHQASFDYTLSKEQNGRFQLYDLTGRLVVANTFVGSGTTTIDLNRFESGLYLYTITVDGLVVQQAKLAVIK